jgi:hypothetical protein
MKILDSLIHNIRYLLFEHETNLFTFSVSSVLNDDTKTYGKKFLLDGKEDTCWNSDHVQIIFRLIGLIFLI